LSERAGLGIGKAWDRMVTSLGEVAGLVIMLIAALSTFDIAMRYLFNSPVVWAGEIGEYLLLVSVFLALALSWREDRHVRVDVIYNRWTKKWRNRANLLFSFWALIFCIALTWYGYLQARQAMVQGETSVTSSAIPTYPVLAFIPIGTLLLSIQIIRSTWKLMKGRDLDDANAPEGSPPHAERN
jgi:C4-dicarboxylate transporter, DctQ subunit